MSGAIRPPSLRTFLDAGCDITTLPGWKCLAEGLLLYPPEGPERAEEVDRLRSWVEEWLQADKLPALVDQATVTHFAWEAECLENPELLERFEAALPPETRVEYLLVSVEMQWPEEDGAGEEAR